MPQDPKQLIDYTLGNELTGATGWYLYNKVLINQDSHPLIDDTLTNLLPALLAPYANIASNQSYTASDFRYDPLNRMLDPFYQTLLMVSDPTVFDHIIASSDDKNIIKYIEYELSNASSISLQFQIDITNIIVESETNKQFKINMGLSLYDDTGILGIDDCYVRNLIAFKNNSEIRLKSDDIDADCIFNFNGKLKVSDLDGGSVYYIRDHVSVTGMPDSDVTGFFPVIPMTTPEEVADIPHQMAQHFGWIISGLYIEFSAPLPPPPDPPTPPTPVPDPSPHPDPPTPPETGTLELILCPENFSLPNATALVFDNKVINNTVTPTTEGSLKEFLDQVLAKYSEKTAMVSPSDFSNDTLFGERIDPFYRTIYALTDPTIFIDILLNYFKTHSDNAVVITEQITYSFSQNSGSPYNFSFKFVITLNHVANSMIKVKMELSTSDDQTKGITSCYVDNLFMDIQYSETAASFRAGSDGTEIEVHCDDINILTLKMFSGDNWSLGTISDVLSIAADSMSGTEQDSLKQKLELYFLTLNKDHHVPTQMAHYFGWILSGVYVQFGTLTPTPPPPPPPPSWPIPSPTPAPTSPETGTLQLILYPQNVPLNGTNATALVFDNKVMNNTVTTTPTDQGSLKEFLNKLLAKYDNASDMNKDISRFDNPDLIAGRIDPFYRTIYALTDPTIFIDILLNYFKTHPNNAVVITEQITYSFSKSSGSPYNFSFKFVITLNHIGNSDIQVADSSLQVADSGIHVANSMIKVKMELSTIFNEKETGITSCYVDNLFMDWATYTDSGTTSASFRAGGNGTAVIHDCQVNFPEDTNKLILDKLYKINFTVGSPVTENLTIDAIDMQSDLKRQLEQKIRIYFPSLELNDTHDLPSQMADYLGWIISGVYINFAKPNPGPPPPTPSTPPTAAENSLIGVIKNKEIRNADVLVLNNEMTLGKFAKKKISDILPPLASKYSVDDMFPPEYYFEPSVPGEMLDPFRQVLNALTNRGVYDGIFNYLSTHHVLSFDRRITYVLDDKKKREEHTVNFLFNFQLHIPADIPVDYLYKINVSISLILSFDDEPRGGTISIDEVSFAVRTLENDIYVGTVNQNTVEVDIQFPGNNKIEFLDLSEKFWTVSDIKDSFSGTEDETVMNLMKVFFPTIDLSFPITGSFGWLLSGIVIDYPNIDDMTALDIIREAARRIGILIPDHVTDAYNNEPDKRDPDKMLLVSGLNATVRQISLLVNLPMKKVEAAIDGNFIFPDPDTLKLECFYRSSVELPVIKLINSIMYLTLEKDNKKIIKTLTEADVDDFLDIYNAIETGIYDANDYTDSKYYYKYCFLNNQLYLITHPDLRLANPVFLNFFYYSTQDDMITDTDRSVIDDELLILGTVIHYKNNMGIDFSWEQQMFDKCLESYVRSMDTRTKMKDPSISSGFLR
jgi:hypothetical protein